PRRAAECEGVSLWKVARNITSTDIGARRCRITQHVGNYSVAVFGISNRPGGEILKLCGSGTLVANPPHTILTAARVWHALKLHQWIALTLKAEIFQCFRISTDLIEPVLLVLCTDFIDELVLRSESSLRIITTLHNAHLGMSLKSWCCSSAGEVLRVRSLR